MSKIEMLKDLEVTQFLYFCNTEKQYLKMLGNDEPLKGIVRSFSVNEASATQLANEIESELAADKQIGPCRSIQEMSVIVGLYVLQQMPDGIVHMRRFEPHFRAIAKLSLAKQFFALLKRECIAMTTTSGTISEYTVNRVSLSSKGNNNSYDISVPVRVETKQNGSFSHTTNIVLTLN